MTEIAQGRLNPLLPNIVLADLVARLLKLKARHIIDITAIVPMQGFHSDDARSARTQQLGAQGGGTHL